VCLKDIFQYSLSYDKLAFSRDNQFLVNRAFIFQMSDFMICNPFSLIDYISAQVQFYSMKQYDNSEYIL
jgi:hypothetical protein